MSDQTQPTRSLSSGECPWLVFFLVSAIGVADPDRVFGLYLAAVLLLLLNAAVSFLRLLTTAFGEDSPDT